MRQHRTGRRFWHSLNVVVPVILAFTLSISIAVEAQVESGKIVGAVRDPSGALLPDSEVTVTETQTNVSHMVKTDGDGGYIVTELKPGTYSVTVAHEGFKTAVEAGFKLDDQKNEQAGCNANA